MPRVEFLRGRAFRLALAFACAISLATASVFTLIYAQVRREDTVRISSILVYETKVGVAASEESLREALAARQTIDIRRVDYIALFDAHGGLVFGNLNLMPPVPIDGAAHWVGAENISATGGAAQSALFAARARPDGGVLVIGRDLSESYQLQSILLRVLAIALLPTVFVTLVIGAVFSSRSSRRLHSVQTSIARIIAGDLTVRLPISREDDEIDKVARAVNVMLDEIARLLHQFKSVGDNIAHDLRSPLMVARGKVERAVEVADGNVDLTALLSGVLAQLDRAAVTIEALLRISTLEGEQSAKRFSAVDLARVCAEAFDFFEPLAQQKTIELSVVAPEPIWIQGDQDLVREAVSNLVENAIKFTPAGGEVRIACGLRGDEPFLEVRDNGPGVPPQEREEIFRRFYRAADQASLAGHGLGLSIAKTIAELHGFELRVEDGAPGARFVMRATAKAALSLQRARPA
jgi:signal transduction histidine kinase